jgi:hypothetical protein
MFGSHSTEPVDEHGARLPEPPRTVGPEVSTFQEKEEAEREKEKEYPHSEGEGVRPSSAASSALGSTLVRKFGSLLVGRTEGGTMKRGNRSATSPRPSADIRSMEEEKDAYTKEREDDEKTAVDDKEDQKLEKPAPSLVKSASLNASQPVGTTHRRAATILDPQGRSRHERRSSTGAAFMGASASMGGGVTGGTVGRHRRPSTGYSTSSSKPQADRIFSKNPNEGELAEQKEEEEAQGREEHDHGDGGHLDTDDDRDDGNSTDREFKPVFLKGLFRYVIQGFSSSVGVN